MEVKAKLSYLRISPRKVRLVADLVRGKSTKEAEALLKFTIKKAKEPIERLLHQAISNAKNNSQLDESNLYISKITVDEGPKYKRLLPRSRGRADQIHKKTSHVTIILGEIDKNKKKVGEKIEVGSIKEGLNVKKNIKKNKVRFEQGFSPKAKSQNTKGTKMFRRKSA